MRHSKLMSLQGHTVVYGGSFNPPHMGHQMACLYLLEALSAEVVWLVPSRIHPLGKVLADFRERAAMCRLLAQPFRGRVEVSMVEEQGGLSGRTYDTIVHLKRVHSRRRFALAVGSDILAEAKLWHRWNDIVELVRVILIGREGYPEQDQTPVALPAVSSTQIREQLSRDESIEGLVPRAIAEYISERVLYRG